MIKKEDKNEIPDLEFEDMPEDFRFTPDELDGISPYVKEQKPAPNMHLKELEELKAKYAQQQMMLKRLEAKFLQTDRTLK